MKFGRKDNNMSDCDRVGNPNSQHLARGLNCTKIVQLHSAIIDAHTTFTGFRSCDTSIFSKKRLSSQDPPQATTLDQIIYNKAYLNPLGEKIILTFNTYHGENVSNQTT